MSEEKVSSQSKPTCGGCKFSLTTNLSDLREPIDCRRFPPSIAQFITGVNPNGVPNVFCISRYPQVKRLDVACGEYVPKLAITN